ncbi:MAG: outer membrane beta-barrel protein [Cellvibrionaceae bacterium]
MIKESFKICVAVASLGILINSADVSAYEKGDLVVRVGAATVDPDSSSNNLKVNQVGIPGTNATVDANTQVGLTLTYMLSNHIGLELLASTPFKHTATLRGGSALLLPNSLDVADVKHLPPTLSLQYFPLSSGSKFQPYAGIGINYTIFFSEELNSETKALLGSGDVSLDNSLGLAFEVGADYQLTDTLSLNASIWKADIDTTADIDLDIGLNLETDIEIDPIVYMVGLGFKF